MLPQQIKKSPDCSPKSRLSMVSSSSLILSSMFSVIVKLIGEFTSLEEPTDDSDIAAVMVFLPMDLILLDLRGELNPRKRRKSLSFQMSGPSPDLGFRRCSVLPFEKGRTPVLSAIPWICDSTTIQNIVFIAKD
jgi:hypothetical protein